MGEKHDDFYANHERLELNGHLLQVNSQRRKPIVRSVRVVRGSKKKT